MTPLDLLRALVAAWLLGWAIVVILLRTGWRNTGLVLAALMLVLTLCAAYLGVAG